jgi:molybdopterin biosynthesis enzyme
MQIAIKPAKPFAFGLLASAGGREVPVFGLPGNPVSSLVSFELLARPALRQMAGHSHPGRPTVDAVAVDGLPRRPDGKIHYMRVFAEFGPDGRVQVRSIGAQGSHQLAATSMANAIAEVPDGAGVEPGGTVRTLLMWVA